MGSGGLPVILLLVIGGAVLFGLIFGVVLWIGSRGPRDRD